MNKKEMDELKKEEDYKTEEKQKEELKLEFKMVVDKEFINKHLNIYNMIKRIQKEQKETIKN